jgi:hypothetical protein
VPELPIQYNWRVESLFKTDIYSSLANVSTS